MRGKARRKIKQFLSALLCAAMVVTTLPADAFAAENSSSIEFINEEIIDDEINDELEDDISSDDDALEDEEEEIEENSEDVVEAEEEITVVEDDTVISDEVIEEESTDIVESEENDSEESSYFTDGDWIYDIVNDNAVIYGYMNTDVSSLAIPYEIDGYYVNAIADGAFVDCEKLSKLYVHGNVVSIADDAFEGLDITLSGYNGTQIMRYAISKDISFDNRTDVTGIDFTDEVIDFSYAERGSYEIVDTNTIRFRNDEAAQLREGSILYVPEALENLIGVYEVTTMNADDDWTVVDLKKAAVDDAVERIVIDEEELVADWDRAVWADEVELIEEKAGGEWSMGVSQNIQYKTKIPKCDNMEFTVSGTIGLKGSAKFDYSVWNRELNTCEVITEPSVQLKAELKASKANKSKDEELRSKFESTNKNGDSFEVYVCTVPLVSVAKVVEVQAAVYFKVSVDGSISISVKGAGKMGVKYDKAQGKFVSAGQGFKWDKPVVELSGNLEFGPAEALQLELAIVGRVVSVDLFHGVTVSVKWTSKQVECVDANMGYKIDLSINLKIPIKKLTANTKINVLTLTGNIGVLHYEFGKGFVKNCSYKNCYTVDFVTYTADKIPQQILKGGDKVTEPTLNLSGNSIVGWYTDKNYKDKWDFNKTIKNSMTLYAKWNKQLQKINYHCNYEGKDFTEEGLPGQKITKPLDPMWMDHEFMGWYKDEALTTAWNFSSDKMPDKELDLYAKWEEREGYDPYKITQTTGGNFTFDGHTYQHIATYMTYAEAKAYCEGLGGYMVTINSKDEQDAIANYVNADCAQTYLWLGMDSLYHYEYWKTGEKVDYENWNSGSKPTVPDSQYNVALIRSTGKWEPLTNTSTAHVIVEWGAPDVDDDFDESYYLNYKPSTGAGSVGNSQDSIEDYDLKYACDSSTGTAKVIGVKDGVTLTDVVIPAMYNGYVVTAIGASAFSGKTSIKTVSIPNTVTTIENQAFYNCSALTSVVIPDEVTSMGTNVFQYCYALTSVQWTSGLDTIPGNTFYNCNKLTDVNNIGQVKKIGTYAFAGCTVLSTFAFQQGLETIDNYAFNGAGLTKVELPDTVTKLGNYAFYNCTKLKKVVLSNGLTSLPSYSFSYCAALETMLIPKNITSIDTNMITTNTTCLFYVYSNSTGLQWCKNKGFRYELLDSTQKRVSFVINTNGVDMESKLVDREAIADQFVSFGNRVREPEISIEGFELLGWYKDETFKTKWDFAKNTTIDSDLILYAKWNALETDYEYTVTNGKATITKYLGNSIKVIIPEKIDGYSVSAIASGAFKNDVTTSIIITRNIGSIEAEAFTGLSKLYSISLDNNARYTVENGVLYSADKTKLMLVPQGRYYPNFTIPEETTSVYANAFANHTELNTLYLLKGSISFNQNAFAGLHDLKVYGPIGASSARTYMLNRGFDYNRYTIRFFEGDTLLYTANGEAGTKIKDTYTFTNEYARFAGWYRDSALTQRWDFSNDLIPQEDLKLYLKWESDFITNPEEDGNMTIVSYKGTSTDVVVPESIEGRTVTKIQASAFGSRVTSITIPSTVTDIERSAIRKTTKIIGDADTEAQRYAELYGNVFELRKYTVTFYENGGSACNPIQVAPGETITLPTPVKTNYYFCGWYSNKSYDEEYKWTSENVMPTDNLKLYASWKIANNNITDRFSYEILSDGTISITNYSGTKTSLEIPRELNGYTVSKIGDYAFCQNEKLLTVTIPSTVNAIGDYVFANTSIRIINGGENVASIGEYAFSGMSGLRTIELSDKLTKISAYAFMDCSSLSEMTIPEGVTEIGERAFYDCTHLEEVTFPSTITRIGSQAFINNDLEKVVLPSTLRNKLYNVFDPDVEIEFYASSNITLFARQYISATSAYLEWNEVADAKAYDIYRLENGIYKKRKTVTDVTNTTYYGLTAGNAYTFMIKAVDADGNVLAASNEVTVEISTLAYPSVVSVTQLSDSSAKMTLKTISGANGYEIYKSNDYDGEYSLLKSIDTNVTTNTGLVGGVTYYYKVRAYAVNENGDKTYSSFSEAFAFTMSFKYLEAPQDLVIYQSKPNGVALSWSEVDGADGYYVYRKENDEEDFELVKIAYQTSTSNLGLLSDGNYQYKVCAFYSENGDIKVGKASKTVTIKLEELATPGIKSIVQKGSTAVTLTWSKVTGASGYYIYRSTSLTGTYKKIKEATTNTLTTYGLKVGTKYYFKVASYITNKNGDIVTSGLSLPVVIEMMPVSSTNITSVIQTGDTEIKVAWDAIDSATGYEIWYKVRNGSDYVLAKTVDTATNNATLTGLNNNTLYDIKVRGYLVDGETKYGEFSEPVRFMCIGTPTITLVEQTGKNEMDLLWSRSGNALCYEVWRSEDGGKFIKQTVTSSAYYTDRNVEEGVEYYYKVRAYNYLDGEKVTGLYSEEVGNYVLGTTHFISTSQKSTSSVVLNWARVSDADGYVLYKCNLEDGTYSILAEQRSSTYTDRNVAAGNTYIYKVMPYIVFDGLRHNCVISDPATVTMLATPVITLAEHTDKLTVKFSWNAVEKATGYHIYQSVDSSELGERIATVEGVTTATVKIAEEGKFFFRVVAFADDGEEEHQSAKSNAKSLYVTDLVTPTISVIEQKDDSTFILDWEESEGAVGYDVLYSATADGTFEHLKYAYTSSVEIPDVELGKRYFYQIRPFKRVDGKAVYGGKSAIHGAVPMVTPNFVNVEQKSTTSIYVQWKSVSYANRYHVYMATEADGEYRLVYNGSGTSYNFNSLETDKKYYFKIRSNCTNATYVDSYSVTDKAEITLTSLEKVTLSSFTQNDDTTPVVNWNEVEGADGYGVYIYDSKTGIYELYKYVSDNTCAISGRAIDSTYAVRVRAYRNEGAGKAFGAYSDVRTVRVIATPVVTNIEQKTRTSISLTWNRVNYATSYYIYYSSSLKGPYELLKTVTTSSSVITEVIEDLAASKTHYFKIQAYTTNYTQSTSAFSAVQSLRLCSLPEPVISTLTQTGGSTLRVEWDKNTRAEGYEIYQATGTGAFSLVAEVTDAAFDVTGVTKGVKYSYKVRSFLTSGGVRLYSGFSEIKTVEVIEAPVITCVYQQDKSSNVIVWKNVSSVGYEVYMSTDGKNFSLLTETTDSSYTHTGISVGKTYYYKVHVKSYSIPSDIVSIKAISFTDGTYPESDHPYTNSMNQKWSYSISGAKSLVLKFNSQTAFENNYDKLYITDANGNPVNGVTYYTSSQLSNAYIIVPGDTVNLQMTTDGSVTYYGFSFDFIKPGNN